MQRSLLRIKDYSMRKGVGGILCYVTTRMRQRVHTFDEDYLQDMERAAQNLLLFCSTNDYRSRNFALQFIKMRQQTTWTSEVPTFEDVLTLPTFAPRIKTYWEMNIDGVIGYMIHILLRYKDATL
jgi:hypothetical protein